MCEDNLVDLRGTPKDLPSTYPSSLLYVSSSGIKQTSVSEMSKPVRTSEGLQDSTSSINEDPLELKLDHFTDLEDGSFMIGKDSPTIPLFPLASNSGPVRK